MNLKSIWYPLLAVFLLSSCEQQTPAPTPAGDTRKSLPEDGAPVIPDQPVQGTVLGSAFSAEQIRVDHNEITFRQGKDFFADRAVSISVFPDEFPIQKDDLPGVPVRSGTIRLSEKKASENLPSNIEVSAYKLALVFGAREKLGVPVQIDLEITGANATRIIGRGFATFEDIHVVGNQIDLRWDSMDTVRHVAKEYVRHEHAAQEVEFEGEFGLVIRDPGTGTEPKTAFAGYELSVAGAPTSLVKLQLQKDENGWRVANALPIDQIDDAHPLDTTIEGERARTRPEAVAGQMLEAKLQREQLMPKVRSTYVSCIASAEGGHGSCDTRYELSKSLSTPCYLQNYRLAYRGGSWVVVGELGPKERVDVSTGAIVKHEPSMFGCRLMPIL